MPLYQEADARLTLTRVARAPVLVAEVAKATGRHLEVSPALGNEVLMVSVQDARLGDVLAKLALAATATWQPIEGGYRLVADGGARSVEASAERARRRQAIEENLKKKAEAAKAAPKADPGAAFMGAFMGSRSVDAFVPMIDLAAVAAMPSGDRIVFATGPTPAQRPLRGDPTSVVAGWIAQHNESARKMASDTASMPEGMDALMKGPLGDRFKRMSRPILGNPTKVIVVASRGAMPFFGGSGLNVRLEVRGYGADGSVLIEETGSLDGDMMGLLASLTGAKTAPASDKATPIAYSDDAKSLAGLSSLPGLSSMGGVARGPKPSASLKKLLLSSSANDPLALIPGEGLVALAKARRKPLVACLPDGAYPAMLSAAPPKTVEDVEEGLKTGPMRLVPDAEFLVVKAAEPDTARRTRLDRSALGTLLRAVEDHEAPSLDELSAFAAASPAPSQNPLSMAMLTLFVPGTMNSMSGMVSWDALRLYAALAPAQRQSLASGAKIPFNAIAPGGQAALQTMLYGASGGVTVEREGVSSEPDPLSIGIKMAMGGGSTDARDEPTEVAPSGLPANGYLQASVTTEPIVRPLAADGPSASTLDTDTFAVLRLLGSSGANEEMEKALKLPDNGRMGSRTAWSLKGYVAPGAFVAASLNDDRTPKDGQQVSLTNLPDDLQKRIAQRTEKMRSSPLGAILAMAAAAGKTSPPREP